MKVINFMGANATGKSTRTKVMVDYLKTQFGFKEFLYDTNKKDQQNIGYLFDNGWLILGNETKGGNSWISIDKAFFTSHDDRQAFIMDLIANYEVEVLFMEGYFNNRSERCGPQAMRDIGVTTTHILFSYYDNMNQYIARTNGRTGKTRGPEWAEKATGWKDNAVFEKRHKSFLNEIEFEDAVERVDIDETVEFLVQTFFDPSWSLPDPVDEPNELDEWL